MIDQTYHDEGTLTKAYDALGRGRERTAEAVEFVSRLLSAGLLIRERTPDTAAPNEPTPAGPYPANASLEEQRRAFVLSHMPPVANPELAVELEKFLAGPENAVDPEPVTSGEANTPLAKLSDIESDPGVATFVSANTYPNDLPHNPFVTGSNEAEAWLGGYTRGIRWERDRRTDHEDQASYDRGWRNGRETAVHIAESDAQKRGWNAALDELVNSKLSLAVLSSAVHVLVRGRVTVRDIIAEMKKL